MRTSNARLPEDLCERCVQACECFRNQHARRLAQPLGLSQSSPAMILLQRAPRLEAVLQVAQCQPSSRNQ